MVIIICIICVTIFHIVKQIKYIKYIYEVNESHMSRSQEIMAIEKFNSQFTAYGGEQKGRKLKELMENLVNNANTYKNEVIEGDSQKCPMVCAHQLTDENNEIPLNAMLLDENYKDYNNSKSIIEENFYNYIDSISKIKEKIEINHMYNVSFEYYTTGILKKIHIFYDLEQNNDYFYNN